ncbi:MAG: nucleoid-associated protein [Armatimonadota bacterium]
MQPIEAIEINRLAIHGISNFSDEPDIADREEVLSEGLRHFFEEHIRNCAKSPGAKAGKFRGSDRTVSACAAQMMAAPDEFVEKCAVIGKWFAHQTRLLSDFQTYLAVALFTDPTSEERYLAILKLDPVTAYVRRSNVADFEQVKILPDPTRHLGRFAILQPYNDDARYDLIFRNQPFWKDEDPESAAIWLDGFLEAEEVATPRQMTQLVMKETERWIESRIDEIGEESAAQLRNAVRTLAQSDELDIEAIASEAIPDENHRGDYIGRLLDRGLTETRFAPDRAWAERASRRTTYLCDDGVQISGPSDVIDDVVQILPRTPDRKTRIVIETRRFVMK